MPVIAIGHIPYRQICTDKHELPSPCLCNKHSNQQSLLHVAVITGMKVDCQAEVGLIGSALGDGRGSGVPSAPVVDQVSLVLLQASQE